MKPKFKIEKLDNNAEPSRWGLFVDRGGVFPWVFVLAVEAEDPWHAQDEMSRVIGPALYDAYKAAQPTGKDSRAGNQHAECIRRIQ